jgi:hypothetical protein
LVTLAAAPWRDDPFILSENAMRWITLPVCAVALVACAKSETPADTTKAAAATPVPAAAPAPAKLQLSDVAGKWNVKAMNEAGDTTLVSYVLTATGDTTGWTIQFADRPAPVAAHVTADGDSVVLKAGPYPSVLRKGVQVSTDGALHLRDGKLVGMTTAHYSVKTADSVRKIKTEGTRAP